MPDFECPKCGYKQSQPQAVTECMHPCGGKLQVMTKKEEPDG